MWRALRSTARTRSTRMMWNPNSVSTTSLIAPSGRAKVASSNAPVMSPLRNQPRSPPAAADAGSCEYALASSVKSSPARARSRSSPARVRGDRARRVGRNGPHQNLLEGDGRGTFLQTAAIRLEGGPNLVFGHLDGSLAAVGLYIEGDELLARVEFSAHLPQHLNGHALRGQSPLQFGLVREAGQHLVHGFVHRLLHPLLVHGEQGVSRAAACRRTWSFTKSSMSCRRMLSR